MIDEDMMIAPPRLVDGDDEIGQLLRERQETWDAAQRRAQSSRAQFAALRERRNRRSALRSGLGLTAAAAALVGLTSLGHFLVESSDGPRLVAAPDRMHVSHFGHADPSTRPVPTTVVTGIAPSSAAIAPGAPAAQTNSTPAFSPSSTPVPALVSRERAGVGTPLKRTSPSRANQQSSASRPDASAQQGHANQATVGHQGRDCQVLKYAEAHACYTQKSEGNGITAELAYLERARLEQKQGKDAAAALRSLNEYQRRFPHGTLQPEATLSRIVLLVSTHQNREARAAIAQALPRMPEKAAQLREVALDLAVAAGDCAEAKQLLKQIPAEVARPAWKTAHLGRCAQFDP